MDIIRLNKTDLLDFIQSDFFSTSDQIPISTIRALSQIANPRARKEDILLIVVRDEGKLSGYLGILPDDIFGEENTIHCGWISCIWVSPDQRGNSLGKKMLHLAYQEWKGHLLGTEFVPALENMYRKSGYFEVFKLYAGKRFYFSFDFQRWLPPRHSFWNRSKPVLRFVDNFMNGLVWNLRTKPGSDHHQYRVEKIPEDINVLIDQTDQSLNAFKRRYTEIDWLYSNPWISPEYTPETERYYFSVFDPTYRQWLYQYRNAAGELECFMFLSKRNKTLKIPYFFCKKNRIDWAIDLIHQLILEHRISTLVSWQQSIIHELTKSPFKLFQKKAFRVYMVSKSLTPFLRDTIQDGDGDCGFV